jgi:hypothetical protein
MPGKYTKMYYILSDESEKPKFDAYVNAALLDSKYIVTANVFGKGKTVLGSNNVQYHLRINHDYSKTGKIRDRIPVLVHNSDYIFLASERLQELLKETSAGQIEFFHVSFEYNSTVFDKYKIVNVLNKIECIDYEQSEITFESYNDNDEGEGDIYAIEGLVFDESLIPPHLNIFLLGRSNSSIIVVHERLRDAVHERKMSGFVFCDPEDFEL